MHARRWLTALIILPLLLLVLFKGGHVLFVLLLLVVNGLAQWEFLGMFQPRCRHLPPPESHYPGIGAPPEFLHRPAGQHPVQPNRSPLRVGGDSLSPLPLLPHRLQPHCRPEPGFDGQYPGPPLYPPAFGALCLAALPERRPVVGPLAPAGDHGRGYRGVLRRPDLGQDQALSRGEPGEDLGRGGGGHGRRLDRRPRPGPLGPARA